MKDDIVTIEEFCRSTGKTRRQVWRLYSLHSGLKVQVPGEKDSRVNTTRWLQILANPAAFIKPKKRKKLCR